MGIQIRLILGRAAFRRFSGMKIALDIKLLVSLAKQVFDSEGSASMVVARAIGEMPWRILYRPPEKRAFATRSTRIYVPVNTGSIADLLLSVLTDERGVKLPNTVICDAEQLVAA